MFKAVLFLLLLAAVTVFSFALAAKSEKIEISTPVLAGSPIIVFNQ